MDVERYFQKSELIPAVVQEAGTGEVLMLAYMNRESLEKTFETGYTWFYSRSRQELWNKGATSGHIQKVIDIKADCDDDTLLITVIQARPAIPVHTAVSLKIYGKKKEDAPYDGRNKRPVRSGPGTERHKTGRFLHLLSL